LHMINSVAREHILRQIFISLAQKKVATR
jgi:hypothetical protein